MSRRQHSSFSRFAQIVVSLVCLALPALAGPAVTINSDANSVYNSGTGPYVLGWQFSITAPLQVTSLGFWDYLGDGFRAPNGNPSEDVGIWDTAQTPNLLVSISVSSTDPLTNVLADGSGFRFASLGSVLTLQPGTYIIGGTNHNTESYLSYPASDVTYDPAVTWISGMYAYSDGLTVPNIAGGGTPAGWFGANFETGAPEPGTITFLLLGSGLLALLARRARSRSRIPD